jgi:E3 ubiquitin-protein ligase HUWE1
LWTLKTEAEENLGYIGDISLKVRRNNIFEDSFNKLRPLKAAEMKGRMNIRFDREEGVDAGGVSREWFTILAREMFNANYGLFIPSGTDGAFQPNKNSYLGNSHHLDYFHFIGRIIGKALYDGQLLDCHFTRSFYKHILGVPVHYSDMEALDFAFYKNLRWILKNDITDLDLMFTFEHEVFGKVQTVELIPEGGKVAVSNENKEEYVKCVSEFKMTLAIRKQIDR